MQEVDCTNVIAVCQQRTANVTFVPYNIPHATNQQRGVESWQPDVPGHWQAIDDCNSNDDPTEGDGLYLLNHGNHSGGDHMHQPTCSSQADETMVHSECTCPTLSIACWVKSHVRDRWCIEPDRLSSMGNHCKIEALVCNINRSSLDPVSPKFLDMKIKNENMQVFNPVVRILVSIEKALDQQIMLRGC